MGTAITRRKPIVGITAASALTALALLTASPSRAQASDICDALELPELARVGIMAEVARGIEGDDLSIVVKDNCDISVILIDEDDSDLRQSIGECKAGQFAMISGNIAQVLSTNVIVADRITCA